MHPTAVVEPDAIMLGILFSIPVLPALDVRPLLGQRWPGIGDAGMK
jgi:hypothetical protein